MFLNDFKRSFLKNQFFFYTRFFYTLRINCKDGRPRTHPLTPCLTGYPVPSADSAFILALYFVTARLFASLPF